MSYMLVTLAIVHVSNHKNLRAAWRLHSKPDSLVGAFVCESQLTPSQLRRLPKALRARLVQEVPAE
jgi:hypothetical protein